MHSTRNDKSLGGDSMTKKDEKITIAIIMSILLIVIVLNVIACINIGFAEYMKAIARISERIKIIC